MDGNITLPTKHYFAYKDSYSQSYDFSSGHVCIWELNNKKKAECWRTDVFKLWCWRRLLRVSWTARKSTPSILKEINPEYSLEGLMLKLKLQYFVHLMWRADSLETTLMLGKIEGGKCRGWQKMRWWDGITRSMDMNFSNLWEIVKDRKSWRSAVHGVTKGQTWLNDWTTATTKQKENHKYRNERIPVRICLWELPDWSRG